ncbi:Long-chain-fatty-acid--CoA ligase [Achlya hypogyna]|uniref:Long-chain-fatty-acid--CoA ligase n=1 Tax=Achlya hypogyna TaxID=1202772 RepID=A0A1V9YF94_ACHHY|nr:Long-chain-fatty-acid--CoA ligase [Achlya hypogyna]
MSGAIVAPTNYSRHGPDGVYRSLPPSTTLDVMTLLANLQRTVAACPEQPFLGHRPIDNKVAGPYQWQTYAASYGRVQRIAAGLWRELLVEPTADGHRFLGIYMKNRPEWVLAQYGAFYAGASVVPIYDTLGATSTTFILNQTHLATVVCTTAEISNLLARAPSCPHLRHIVLCDVAAADASLHEAAAGLGLRLWTLAAVETSGGFEPRSAATLHADDMAMLMYTSGTTGDPKGVPMTHGNLNASRYGSFDGLFAAPHLHALLANHPVALSFLPMAHVAEQGLQIGLISVGGALGFYQGDTLKLLEDVQALRPTIFLGVPRLLNKIHDKVVESALEAGGVKAWLFRKALDAKLANLQQGYVTHGVYDVVVFNKLKAALGLDRCQLLLTGAAPLAPNVLSFYRVALGCTCTEMYGQTETGGASTMTDPRDLDAGTVGAPIAGAEIKLVSVPDMGYNDSDTTHGEGDNAIAVRGRGEVCFRGPAVFSGYFKEPEKTAEAIDADGWLHSGDIGVWTTDGRLKIVDRKKNIFKLSQGEYVAPEKIENAIQGSSYVAQSFPPLDAGGRRGARRSGLAKLAASLKITGTLQDWCVSPEVVKTVLADIQRVGKAAGLFGFETIRAVHLEPTPFSIENNLLTPTLKLKRHDATKTYAGKIDVLYAAAG